MQPTTDDFGRGEVPGKSAAPACTTSAWKWMISTAMLAQLKAKGVRLINETPVLGAGGKQIAFIHPKSASGVLVELYQSAG